MGDSSKKGDDSKGKEKPKKAHFLWGDDSLHDSDGNPVPPPKDEPKQPWYDNPL